MDLFSTFLKLLDKEARESVFFFIAVHAGILLFIGLGALEADRAVWGKRAFAFDSEGDVSPQKKNEKTGRMNCGEIFGLTLASFWIIRYNII